LNERLGTLFFPLRRYSPIRA